MTVENALKELITKGAEIEKVETNKYIVTDNGFWGFASYRPPFIVDGEDILEMHEQYCQ